MIDREKINKRIDDLATAIDIINEFDGTDETRKLRNEIRREIEKLEVEN